VPGRAATIVVNSTADGTDPTDGLCTLHEAALAVNTDTAGGAVVGECAAGDAGVDVVTFALAAGSTIASNALPFVFEQSVEIVGPGADALSITTGAPERVMVFDGSANLANPPSFTLRGVTIWGGQANHDHNGRGDDEGGGLLVLNPEGLTLSAVRLRDNIAELAGGGVSIRMRSDGTGLIEDCEIIDNTVTTVINGGGGGLFLPMAGTFTIRRSLFEGNVAYNGGFGGSGEDPDGGALAVAALAVGTLTIESSTFSGNSAQGAGGAIMFGNTAAFIGPAVETTLRDLTINDNHADTDANSASAGGGGLDTVLSDALVTVTNSIIAGNTDGSTASPPANDVHADALTLATAGFNWIGIRAGAAGVFQTTGTPNAQDDWVGSLASPLDPNLGALEDNGGPTRTHLPLPDTTTPIDAGSCSGATRDQRGWFNPVSGLRAFDDPTVANLDVGCDIGAVETSLAAPTPLLGDGFESGNTSAWSSAQGGA
jgi:CSLREA domain-containing protein